MARARVEITATNKMSKGLKSGQKSLYQFAQSAQKVGDTLKQAFAITGVVVAIKKVTSTLTDCFNAFSEAERKYKQLAITLGNGDAFKSVSQNIRTLSKYTLSSKDQIESMASELAGLGKSADDVNAISEAAVYLSNVTGKDLNSSMQMLLKTYNGSTKALNQLGIDTSELTKEQLKNGEAVQLIIDKYGELAKSMAEADNKQHIQNTKNNFNDIKQSIGDLISFTITPLIGKIDALSEKLRDSIDDFVQKTKVVLGNLPEVLSRLWTAIKGGLSKLFSFEGFTNFINNIFDYVLKKIKLIGNVVANLGTLIQNVFSEVIKGIGNYAMYWITSVADKMGVDISEVINSIGTWLVDSPIGKFVDSILSTVINGVKLVGTIIRNLPQIVKIVISHIGDMISAFIKGFPQGIVNTFKGIGQKILAGILNLKNNFLQTVEDALNSIGEWIQNTWVGKAMAWMGLDLGGKLANIDFGIDRTSQYMHEDRASYYFDKAGEAWSGVKEIGAEMAQEINALLSPQIEKWQADSSKSLGEKMAVWTAKSSDAYYAAAKKNFSNIGTFLKDWGADFLGDFQDDWAEMSESFSTIFGDVFGEDFEAFLDWFRPFMEENLKKSTTTTTGLNGGSGSTATTSTSFLTKLGDRIGTKLADTFGATDEQGKAAGNAIISNVTSSLGTAGQLISELATNMATMTPVIGAIVTALKYVIEGFAEVIGPMLEDVVKLGLEPLREIGRVIGNLIMPLLEELMPLFQDSADSFIGAINMIGQALAPVIRLITSVLSPILSQLCNTLKFIEPVTKAIAKVFAWLVGTVTYIVEVFQHIGAVILNWIAGFHIGNWRPFEGISVQDKGMPGSYDSYIKSYMNGIDNAGELGVNGTSTQTAVSSASYRGATSVTINIYAEGPIVGDGGMREFAQMIREEFDALNYYGVSA